MYFCESSNGGLLHKMWGAYRLSIKWFDPAEVSQWKQTQVFGYQLVSHMGPPMI
jgi:nucleoside-specific outer membrane channel protein Tsx